MNIRFAEKSDQDQIIKLIDGVLREYDDSVCLDDAESDLCDIQSHYVEQNGAFWVMTAEEHPNQIIGSHAALPDPSQTDICNFKRLYVEKTYRGQDAGRRLMQVAIDWAASKDFLCIEFWSDTRFERAHRFFEKFGFQRTGDVRKMTDSHIPYEEYFFRLNLDGPINDNQRNR